MRDKKIYDLIGIGIGPFNLSLAALVDPFDEIDALFFDQTSKFEWHPGMLLEGSDLQVPFLADLVTLADPKSPYSFLNFLHEKNRLFKFYFFNRFDIPRREYSDYGAWVASELDNCVFEKRVVDVEYIKDEEVYKVHVNDSETQALEKFHARHIVIGTGSVPMIPMETDGCSSEDVFHSSQYRFYENEAKESESITVVGSGQSAAEVFYELLLDQDKKGYELTWYTRSAGFMQLESAKLGQEVFSPDYIAYFHQLPFEDRKDALSTLDQLRKGIDPETLKQIYDLLYHRSVDQNANKVRIQPLTEVNKIRPNSEGPGYELTCHQWQKEESFGHLSRKVVLATGYKPHLPEWFEQFRDEIEWEDEKRYKVLYDYCLEFKDDRPNHVFTLTNLEHSHGAGATNLGLSVVRNQKIINKIAGKELYKVSEDTVFQQFESK
ncbi:lysine N(6)-hydroxylase/L-ornithine N(5)-oxygenase family protein [Pseudalkalibacillus salsuginis]|uniref:lysine N(6)-hydroxylase/L-ornithine N(5)-oxygenase family protein n=1 Tax=Pseudalkalibacillus salsuginis TaxID=2910972 RepID=UPI001F3043E5|nr:SidA/IucD/PvdA family monooxygenase [Pseudalkalibacillus salsuginis]MCF6411263.1 SidA/IucD/PvdA family monooxygenase [Pseudalkalibacillus salsuginis]